MRPLAASRRVLSDAISTHDKIGRRPILLQIYYSRLMLILRDVLLDIMPRHTTRPHYYVSAPPLMTPPICAATLLYAMGRHVAHITPCAMPLFTPIIVTLASIIFRYFADTPLLCHYYCFREERYAFLPPAILLDNYAICRAAPICRAATPPLFERHCYCAAIIATPLMSFTISPAICRHAHRFSIRLYQ